MNYLLACRWAPWSNSMALFEQRIHQPCILKLEAVDEAESSKKGSWISTYHLDITFKLLIFFY